MREYIRNKDAIPFISDEVMWNLMNSSFSTFDQYLEHQKGEYASKVKAWLFKEKLKMILNQDTTFDNL